MTASEIGDWYRAEMSKFINPDRRLRVVKARSSDAAHPTASTGACLGSALFQKPVRNQPETPPRVLDHLFLVLEHGRFVDIFANP